MTIETPLVVARFVHFANTMVLCGLSLFPFYAFSALEWRTNPVAEHTRLFIQRLVLPGLLLSLISALCWLGYEATEMSGDPKAYRDAAILLTVFQYTLFGQIWMGRLCVLMAVMLYAILARGRNSLTIIGAATTILVISLGGVGHGAIGLDQGISFRFLNQAVHMLAVSVWLGGLLGLFYTLCIIKPDFKLSILKRFSAVGFLAVCVILVSGLINSYLLIGSVNALLRTGYGQVLLVKFAFFTGMVIIALVNRFYIMPNMATHEALLRRALIFEQSLGLLALMTVSILGTLPIVDMGTMTM